jgi:uncharacterized damage-inducible protein DinB
MKKLLLALLLLSSMSTFAQDKTPATLKSILLEQLRSTHNTNDWFVSPSKAVEGLTPEQASWTNGKGNHSIGQLANHLIFWNSRNLARFRGETPAKFSGDNDETFNSFDAKTWANTVKQLDQVMTDIEKFVEAADDATVAKFASAIAHIGTHNAYHTGQILYIRKENGWWDPAKGVK